MVNAQSYKVLPRSKHIHGTYTQSNISQKYEMFDKQNYRILTNVYRKMTQTKSSNLQTEIVQIMKIMGSLGSFMEMKYIYIYMFKVSMEYAKLN